MSQYQKEGVTVLGVSTGSVESHQKFKDKYHLNFPLLADTTSDVAKMYGVWKEKNLYGRRTWGVARATFVIGPDGRVKRVYPKVDPETHAGQILADLKA
jgi:peroxiredoxin Q/BCP